MPSSVVAGFSYDVMSQTLRIAYVSGLIYDYMGVPERLYQQMKAARSKGIFLNKYIKGHFDYKKIET